MKRKFPAHDDPVEKRGVDELQARLEWALRDRPRALENSRRRYKTFLRLIYRHLERVWRG